ncbi:MAG TPA: alpha/beta fold hydrolase [Nevskia sp.]|nr:alpha/beta fold hydrolase [Nevskia sp.]
MRQWKFAPVVLVSAAGMLVSACGSGGDGKQGQSFSSSSAVLFNPVVTSPVQTQAIPLPFDALFSGFATPTLNFPGLPAPLSDINQLDGFSTVAPIFADVAGFLDYKTVAPNIVIINTATGAVLVPGVDFTVDNENATAQIQASSTFAPISQQRSRILISPLKPLAPSTQYLVALLTGMKTTDGNNVVPSSEFIITSSATPVDQQTDPTLAQFTEAQKEQLEALRSQAILPVVQAFNQLAHIPTSQIALAWSFTTQSIDKSLKLVAQNASAGVLQVANTGLTTGQSGIPGLGLASVYVGITTVPYYLNVAAGNHDPSPLSGYWHADPAKPDTSSKFLGQVPCGAFAVGATVNGVVLKPSASTTGCFPVLDASTAQVQKVPVIVTVPDSNSGQAMPSGGWPVVIFQHGITQNRTNVFAVADGLARAGFVVVAMDLPLHGITDNTSPLYHNQLFAGTPAAGLVTGERTFDLDLENNGTSTPGPDGKIDGSGTYFINLQSLITSRDNLREAVADLATLVKSVKNLDLDNDGTPDVNPNRIYYFGHSLGGIVGGTLLGVDSDIRAAVLANPGGGVAKLLDASKSFGPPIAAGLGASGQAEGTDNFPNPPAYETFLRFAQTVVDAGDPVNYGAAASAGHAIDMIEVIGDLVVPNSALSTCPAALPAGISSTAQLIMACPATATQDVTVVPGYLSGTDPLVKAMGLSAIGPLTVPVASPETKTGAQLDYVVQFSPGANGTVGHSTVLDPTHDPLVTQEMQSEAAQFLASDGRCLAIAGSCAR